MMLFAEKEKDKDDYLPIVLVHGYADYYQKWLDEFEAENPGVKAVWLPKGGGIVAVDAFDLSDFKDGALDIYMRGDEVLGLPVTVAVNAFDVNLSLAARVGFEVPDADYLTIDQFLEYCECIKRYGDGGEYGTAIWAGNLGSQAINWHWLSAFGAKFYEGGDYSRTVLNSPEAVKGMNFMKMLVDEGYAPMEAAVLDDDEAIAMWASGKIGGLWARAGGWLGMIDNAIKQGMSDEKFEHVFMTWPVAEGVDGNPLSYGGAAGMVIAHDSEEENVLAAKLLDKMTGSGAQSRTIAPGAGYVTRHSALEPPQDEWPEWCNIIEENYEKAKVNDPGFKHYTKIGKLYNKYGGLDTGASTVYHQAMGQEWLKIFQPFMTGDISAEEALATFEREFNKVLAGE